LSTFATPLNSFAYVTHKADMPVAACFCIHDAQRAYYMLGGVDEEHGAAAAAPMAMFACIRHARDLGLEVYDFEGSMVPGIEQYFRSFGGTLTPLYRVVKASLPIEMALKPFKRSLF
jgi:CelD/BcsL family acetyltransferase involved in cellulose biosynthesis